MFAYDDFSVKSTLLSGSMIPVTSASAICFFLIVVGKAFEGFLFFSLSFDCMQKSFFLPRFLFFHVFCYCVGFHWVGLWIMSRYFCFSPSRLKVIYFSVLKSPFDEGFNVELLFFEFSLKSSTF